MGVPRETFPGEHRVAGTPESVAKLVAQGFRVRVERGAGERAGFADEMVGLGVCVGCVWSGWSMWIRWRPVEYSHRERTPTRPSQTQYQKAGAEVVDTAHVWQSSLVTKVRPPTAEEAQRLDGRALISMVQPAQRADLLEAFQRSGATVFGAFFSLACVFCRCA